MKCLGYQSYISSQFHKFVRQPLQRQSPLLTSSSGMPKDSLERLNWEQFELKFREAFGRDMTPNERRWFQLSKLIVDDPEEKSDGTTTA